MFAGPLDQPRDVNWLLDERPGALPGGVMKLDAGQTVQAGQPTAEVVPERDAKDAEAFEGEQLVGVEAP